MDAEAESAGEAANAEQHRLRRLSQRLSDLFAAHRLAKLGLELMSVFIGVTLAFWLENWREERQREDSSKAVYQAIAAEVGIAARGGGEMDEEIRKGIRDWVARYQRGEKPVPYVYMFERSPRPPAGVWEAALASGLVTLVELPLLVCLARYYRRLESSGETYISYKQFAENEVLPYARDPAWFYDGEGRLKPQYHGSMMQIIRWSNEHARIVRQAQELLPVLEGRAPPQKC
jgi:hypothetical protein